MAKQQFVSVQFTADETGVRLTDIVYKRLPLKDDALRFLHIEKKGNTNLLFDATRFVEELPDSLSIIWDRTGELPTFTAAGRQYTISIYTVLDLELDKPFYHLDELPDGTWRLCHTTGYIPWDHEHVDTIEIVKTPARV